MALGKLGARGGFGSLGVLGTVGYTPEAQALFARATSTLSAAEKTAINTRILRYKAAGAWQLMDALYGFKAQGVASLNWKASAYNLTLNGSISFTANQGYQNAGGYLNTVFTPSTAGGNYNQNSALIGYWVLNPAVGSGLYSIGAQDGTKVAEIDSLGTNALNTKVNQTTGAGAITSAVGTASRTGQVVAERTAAGAFQLSQNGLSLVTGATASLGLPTVPFFIGARNVNGTPFSATSDLYQAGMIGGSLTDDQIASIYNADLEYTTDGVGWGDSLMALGSSSNLMAQLGALFSPVRTFNDQGIGGQTSTQIAARSGAQPITVTVSGNQIPTSGGVSVTAKNINPLTNSGTFTGNLIGTLAGVHGNMTTDGSGNWTFTRFTTGTATSCPVGTQFVPDLSVAFRSKLSFIWIGRNGADAGFAVLTDIAAMTSFVAANYIVLTILNAAYEPSGSAGYITIASENASIASTYGARCYDARAAVVAAYSPGNAIDVLNHADDIPPYTLRRAGPSGTITTATVNPGDTTFIISAAVTQGHVLTIGTEFVYVNSVAGTTITSCVRGYAGTVAGTYASGQAYTSVDPLHLNDAGDAVIAAGLKSLVSSFGW